MGISFCTLIKYRLNSPVPQSITATYLAGGGPPPLPPKELCRENGRTLVDLREFKELTVRGIPAFDVWPSPVFASSPQICADRYSAYLIPRRGNSANNQQVAFASRSAKRSTAAGHAGVGGANHFKLVRLTLPTAACKFCHGDFLRHVLQTHSHLLANTGEMRTSETKLLSCPPTRTKNHTYRREVRRTTNERTR